MIDVRLKMQYKSHNKKFKIIKFGKISNIEILQKKDYLIDFIHCAICDDSFECYENKKLYRVVFSSFNSSKSSERLRKVCEQRTFSLETLEFDSLDIDNNEIFCNFKIKDVDSNIESTLAITVTFSLRETLTEMFPNIAKEETIIFKLNAKS